MPNAGLCFSNFSWRAIFCGLACACLLGVSDTSSAEPASSFIKGADVSFLPALEAAGVSLHGAAQASDPLDIYREAGFNLFRVRLWVGPSSYNPRDGSLFPEVFALARRIKQTGVPWMLDFHYSDFWADPKNQATPAAWKNLPLDALAQRLREYTRDTLVALNAAGLAPSMVQLGNEIRGGFLWPTGKLDGSRASWKRLAMLLRAARQGVDDALGAAHQVRVVLHVEGGSDRVAVERFFDGVAESGVAYDVIGLSHYVYWGGEARMEVLGETIRGYGERYNKPVMIVETAYPWTFEPGLGREYAIKEASALPDKHVATAQAQADYLNGLSAALRSAGSKGEQGWIYWAPDWLGNTPALGSDWGNQTLFDFAGHALPGLYAGGINETLK